MGRRTDGWADGWADGRMDGQADRRMGRRMGRQTDNGFPGVRYFLTEMQKASGALDNACTNYFQLLYLFCPRIFCMFLRFLCIFEFLNVFSCFHAFYV